MTTTTKTAEQRQIDAQNKAAGTDESRHHRHCS